MKLTKALKEFQLSTTPEEAPELLEACALFGKMGWTAKQINELVEAISEGRIVAFALGQARVIGTTDRKEFPWL